jgi:hypothetical protein
LDKRFFGWSQTWCERPDERLVQSLEVEDELVTGRVRPRPGADDHPEAHRIDERAALKVKRKGTAGNRLQRIVQLSACLNLSRTARPD